MSAFASRLEQFLVTVMLSVNAPGVHAAAPHSSIRRTGGSAGRNARAVSGFPYLVAPATLR
jgi:hypothetical protein